MADNTTPSRVPIPAPRVSRTGVHKQPPPSPPLPHQPPPTHYNPQPPHGGGPVRYIPPVTPQSTSLGGYNTSTTAAPSYIHQMSTPTPSSYQHPVTSGGNIRTLKEYSGPQKVMSPAPLHHHDNSDPHINQPPTVTPRKDSWNSSRSSLSSEPPSPLRLVSEEIEMKKEMKLVLLQEIDNLSQQKKTLVEDIDKERCELNELREESEKCNQEVEKLMAEENSIRRRLAQSEQNLQLMSHLSTTSPSATPPSDLLREQNLKKRERELEENQLSLEERSTKIRQTELELQSQADVLFQRKKELDLREYDMRNFKGSSSAEPPVLGGPGSRYPDMLEHEERERKIQLKEDELFQRETRITEVEIELKRERDRLTKWESTVQHEDNRAQQNLSIAKEMMQKANKIKQEALDASKIAAMLDDERKETTTAATNLMDPHGGGGLPHHQGSTVPVQAGSEATPPGGGVQGSKFNHTSSTSGGGISSYGGISHYNPSAASDTTDCSDDLMVARLMNIEMNKALAEEDERLAKEMSTMQVATAKNETEDADFQFAFQTQLELMGIAPGSVGAEELKKQLQEAMDKEKKQNEATLRDSEIAASLRQDPS